MGDQPRERRYEPDHEPEYQPEYAPGGYRPRSGAVTAVAIINFVLGGLQIVCGLIFLLAASWIFGAGQEVGRQSTDPEVRRLASQGGGFLASIAGGIAVVILIIAAVMIVAGIGVVNRRQWGRILTLVLGAISGIFALLSLLGITANPLQALIGLALYGGYTALTYVVLLNSQNAREFS
jgi:hypothetical protein